MSIEDLRSAMKDADAAEASDPTTKKRRPPPPRVKAKPAFVRPKAGAEELDVHPNTIRRWYKNGTLPKPTRLTDRCIGWPRETWDAAVSALASRGGE